LLKIVITFATLLALAFAARLIFEVLVERSIAIQPISMPTELLKNGYTSDLAAIHLRDALKRYTAQSRLRLDDEKSAMPNEEMPKFGLHDDVPDFVVPTVGISFDAIATRIQTMFGTSRRIISGDMTLLTDNKLRLRLRKNGDIIYDRSDGDLQTPDSPLLTQTMPYALRKRLSQIGQHQTTTCYGRTICLV
jgi:hypothetical protein